MFPNPSSSIIYVDLKESTEGEFAIGVYDLLGHRIKLMNYIKDKNTSISIPVGDLMNGQYLLKIQRTSDAKNYPVMKFQVFR